MSAVITHAVAYKGNIKTVHGAISPDFGLLSEDTMENTQEQVDKDLPRTSLILKQNQLVDWLGFWHDYKHPVFTQGNPMGSPFPASIASSLFAEFSSDKKELRRLFQINDTSNPNILDYPEAKTLSFGNVADDACGSAFSYLVDNPEIWVYAKLSNANLVPEETALTLYMSPKLDAILRSNQLRIWTTTANAYQDDLRSEVPIAEVIDAINSLSQIESTIDISKFNGLITDSGMVDIRKAAILSEQTHGITMGLHIRQDLEKIAAFTTLSPAVKTLLCEKLSEHSRQYVAFMKLEANERNKRLALLSNLEHKLAPHQVMMKDLISPIVLGTPWAEQLVTHFNQSYTAKALNPSTVNALLTCLKNEEFVTKWDEALNKEDFISAFEQKRNDFNARITAFDVTGLNTTQLSNGLLIKDDWHINFLNAIELIKNDQTILVKPNYDALFSLIHQSPDLTEFFSQSGDVKSDLMMLEAHTARLERLGIKLDNFNQPTQDLLVALMQQQPWAENYLTTLETIQNGEERPLSNKLNELHLLFMQAANKDAFQQSGDKEKFIRELDEAIMQHSNRLKHGGLDKEQQDLLISTALGGTLWAQQIIQLIDDTMSCDSVTTKPDFRELVKKLVKQTDDKKIAVITIISTLVPFNLSDTNLTNLSFGALRDQVGTQELIDALIALNEDGDIKLNTDFDRLCTQLRSGALMVKFNAAIEKKTFLTDLDTQLAAHTQALARLELSPLYQDVFCQALLNEELWAQKLLQAFTAIQQAPDAVLATSFNTVFETLHAANLIDEFLQKLTQDQANYLMTLDEAITKTNRLKFKTEANQLDLLKHLMTKTLGFDHLLRTLSKVRLKTNIDVFYQLFNDANQLADFNPAPSKSQFIKALDDRIQGLIATLSKAQLDDAQQVKLITAFLTQTAWATDFVNAIKTIDQNPAIVTKPDFSQLFNTLLLLEEGKRQDFVDYITALAPLKLSNEALMPWTQALSNEEDWGASLLAALKNEPYAFKTNADKLTQALLSSNLTASFQDSGNHNQFIKDLDIRLDKLNTLGLSNQDNIQVFIALLMNDDKLAIELLNTLDNLALPINANALYQQLVATNKQNEFLASETKSQYLLLLNANTNEIKELFNDQPTSDAVITQLTTACLTEKKWAFNLMELHFEQKSNNERISYKLPLETLSNPAISDDDKSQFVDFLLSIATLNLNTGNFDVLVNAYTKQAPWLPNLVTAIDAIKSDDGIAPKPNFDALISQLRAAKLLEHCHYDEAPKDYLVSLSEHMGVLSNITLSETNKNDLLNDLMKNASPFSSALYQCITTLQNDNPDLLDSLDFNAILKALSSNELREAFINLDDDYVRYALELVDTLKKKDPLGSEHQDTLLKTSLTYLNDAKSEESALRRINKIISWESTLSGVGLNNANKHQLMTALVKKEPWADKLLLALQDNNNHPQLTTDINAFYHQFMANRADYPLDQQRDGLNKLTPLDQQIRACLTKLNTTNLSAPQKERIITAGLQNATWAEDLLALIPPPQEANNDNNNIVAPNYEQLFTLNAAQHQENELVQILQELLPLNLSKQTLSDFSQALLEEKPWAQPLKQQFLAFNQAQVPVEPVLEQEEQPVQDTLTSSFDELYTHLNKAKLTHHLSLVETVEGQKAYLKKMDETLALLKPLKLNDKNTNMLLQGVMREDAPFAQKLHDAIVYLNAHNQEQLKTIDFNLFIKKIDTPRYQHLVEKLDDEKAAGFVRAVSHIESSTTGMLTHLGSQTNKLKAWYFQRRVGAYKNHVYDATLDYLTKDQPTAQDEDAFKGSLNKAYVNLNKNHALELRQNPKLDFFLKTIPNALATFFVLPRLCIELAFMAKNWNKPVGYTLFETNTARHTKETLTAIEDLALEKNPVAPVA